MLQNSNELILPQKWREEQRIGYYRENIFNLEDMYLFKAIFLMYLGQYDESNSELVKSFNTHLV